MPTSNLSLHSPLTPKHPLPRRPQNKKTHINYAPLNHHISQYKAFPRLRFRPIPDWEPTGAGYLEGFKAREARSIQVGAVLKSRVKTLIREYGTFTAIPNGIKDEYELRELEKGRMFHAFASLARMDRASGPLRPLYRETKKVVFLQVEDMYADPAGGPGQWLRKFLRSGRGLKKIGKGLVSVARKIAKKK